MKRPILFLFVIMLLLVSCNNREKPGAAFGTGDSLGKGTAMDSGAGVSSPQMLPRHKIDYATSINRSHASIAFDTSTTRIRCNDTIVSYSINPMTKQVLRLCAKKDNRKIIRYLLLDDRKIEWNNAFGFPHEFIGNYLFSDIYRGGALGGTITKNKFRVSDYRLEFTDSIPGGSYSEGAGTWEWLISGKGEPKAIIFHGGDLWVVDDSIGKLLITSGESSEKSPQTHFIDLQSNDTLFSRPIISMHTWHQLIADDGILISGQTVPRLCYLKMYNLNGQVMWTSESDYFEKMMIDHKNGLIIGAGYYFPESDNTKRYFTVAFDKTSGQRKWDFPTSIAYDAHLNPTSTVTTSDIFAINDDLYGMIVGQVPKRYGPDINCNNKLILFNSDGLLYRTIDLSSDDQNYSVIVKGKNEFDIVSCYETRRFTIRPE